jgi:protein-S-isoprenylcysteine O-methyltransferase Ste14
LTRRVVLSAVVAGSLGLTLGAARGRPAWALVELVLLHFLFVADLWCRPPAAGEDLDRRASVLTTKGYMAALVYLPLLGWGPGWPHAPMLGTGVTALGALVTLWARLALGRSGTEVLTILPDHRLHTGGPYRLVRHPIYAGFALAFLGHQVAFSSAPGLVLWLLFALHILRGRIRREEAMLLEHFGDQYGAYMRRTWKMFPCLY